MKTDIQLRRVRKPAVAEAFTLIELLVTLVIVGILAALLLPALAGAKRSARSVRSMSNVRQLGLGMSLYAQDHRQLPRDPREAESSNWVYSITAYVGDVDGVRTCPADPLQAARMRAFTSGYVLNYYTSGGRPLSFNGPLGEPVMAIDPDRDVDSFPRPSETFLLFEASNAGAGPDHVFDDHTHPDTWLVSWGHVLADIDPVRRGRGANSFCRRHVTTISAASLRARIESGDNFAEIPR